MNKKMTNMIKISTITVLLIGIVYFVKQEPTQFDIIIQEMTEEMDAHWDTVTFDKQQIIKTKEDVEYTRTTQGERTFEEMLSIEPDYMYYDTNGSQREADSVDAYMRHWYEVLDTNSDGEIDGDYNMGCGGEVHDSIIEWLEE